ncbi:hypothetical protein FOL46_007054, partial [Perkinsus olseni]
NERRRAGPVLLADDQQHKTVSFYQRLIEAILITTAQDVGKFVYEGPLFSMTYDVNEDQEVTFTVHVPEPPLRRGDIPVGVYLSLGPYPLRSATGFTYSLDFDEAGTDALHWRVELDRFLRNTGLMDHDEVYPSDPSQDWDLTVLTYQSGDSISTNFQNAKIEFKRVAAGVTLGNYVFEFH